MGVGEQMKYPECTMKESQKLYKIGMFSQINRLSIKALRYYDEVDLLKPEYVDESNGYRYYTSAQLPQLHKILALRDMDFSIQEIKEIQEGACEKEMLMKKKHRILKNIAKESEKLAKVEGYLSGSSFKNDYKFIMKSIPEVTIASMKLQLNSYDELFYRMPEMGLEMEKAGCSCQEPEYCFTIYYDGGYRESDITAEICEAVNEKKEDQEHVKFRVLSSVDLAICVLHKGPYDTLSLAYKAIVEFMEESGYEIVGEQRESYIDGIWNKDSEEDWLTEIQFPVRKI